MGRMVTNKRSELYALIRSGGSQPLHIDREVWERLVNLESSKQRKDKSEQGRKANASRKTYGRTGRTGMNGVREKLREEFNRSPDPDEIEFEMNRDKGFGGYKRKKLNNVVKQERESQPISSGTITPESQSGTPISEHGLSDGEQHRSVAVRPSNETVASNTLFVKVNGNLQVVIIAVSNDSVCRDEWLDAAGVGDAVRENVVFIFNLCRDVIL